MTPTFDPAPVLRFIDASTPGASSRVVAERLGVSDGAVRLWRAGKRHMRSSTADLVAVKLGMHPSNIWPTW